MRKSQIDKAIEKLKSECDVLNLAIARLEAQKAAGTRKPSAAVGGIVDAL